MSRNATAPSVSAKSSASRPAEVSASAPFGSAEATIRSAKAPEASTSPREGSVRRTRSRHAARTAVATSARSTGPIETSAPPTASSTLGRSRARRSERTTAARKTRNERSRTGTPPSTGGRLRHREKLPLRLRDMRITFLTGIWPPDVGGPATHGPDFARFLVARGHHVHVVTMGDGEPSERPCEVEVVSRRWPFPVRYGLVTLAGARAARRCGRRLRDRDLRGGRRGLGARAPPARREARLRPRVRASAALPALRRDARGVPAGRWALRRGAEGGADARAPAGEVDRRPERVPRRHRAKGGACAATASAS